MKIQQAFVDICNGWDEFESFPRKFIDSPRHLFEFSLSKNPVEQRQVKLPTVLTQI